MIDFKEWFIWAKEEMYSLFIQSSIVLGSSKFLKSCFLKKYNNVFKIQYHKYSYF
jgi:hypothetical protein